MPGLPLNPPKDQPEGFEEAMQMDKNVKKEQQKLTRARRHDERRAKRERAKRSRPNVRKARQEEKRLKDSTRAARRKERKQKEMLETTVELESEKKLKSKKRAKPEPSLVDDKVKSILTRASIRPVGERKVIQGQRRARSTGSGWKPGKNLVASELPQLRKGKKLTNSTVTKLLRAAMKATAKIREGSDEKSPEVGAAKEDLQFNSSEAPRALSCKEFLFEAEQGPALKEFLNNQVGSPKQKQKRYKKRAAKNLRLWDESSDEEEDMETERRSEASARPEPTTADLTESSSEAELTETTDDDTDSADSDEDLQVNLWSSSMKGGAWQEPITGANMIKMAIEQAGENLMLDKPTKGDWNCCSCALVQQCQRPPVKLFLQSRGVTIQDLMQLKENVAQFIYENRNTEKILYLRRMFEYSEMNIHHEGMKRRNWSQYWYDMKQDAGQERNSARWKDYWADEIWLKAAAYYLNLNVHIIWAGDDTGGRLVSDVDGDWSPVDEEKPTLYLGYIVNAHYQSLLPRAEHHPTPAYLLPEAIDNAMAGMVYGVMQGLDEEQNNKVSLSS